ncbi:nucleotidyltransferase family protein [Actinocrispum wychmicini]|uniref:Nucleotidyltransferase-like protein n=1 Tax=Actinocrispum wychmicini TaxID=1213861 RepID=A0A4R2JP33_9PSEU|nr:sugar phosphate nucleotidyltransferase [Actinocrispum wychmicini]TCO61903.1 nucleotidyltransferase-like protein [Actinocrispum wychmicini]
MTSLSPAHAILLAGGRGTRLHPYTLTSPKPLISMDRWTILEIIIRQLRSFGVTRVTLCVSHLAEMIMDQCGDGSRFGVTADYCVDMDPRGTAGPLASVVDWTEPAVVMNADILTRMNFADLYAHHTAGSAVLTVAAHVQDLDIDYGLVHVVNGHVVDVVEKPRMELNVSAGIYVASPEVRDHIPADQEFGMNELMQQLLLAGRTVSAYRFSEDWYDIGTPQRLADARRSFAAKPSAFLRESVSSDRMPATKLSADRP